MRGCPAAVGRAALSLCGACPEGRGTAGLKGRGRLRDHGLQNAAEHGTPGALQPTGCGGHFTGTVRLRLRLVGVAGFGVARQAGRDVLAGALGPGVPASVLQGWSLLGHPDRQVERVPRLIPGARAEIIPRTGHGRRSTTRSRPTGRCSTS
ncbi:hypothetical protein SSP531S_43600 [Streptomyces spongiicola]|uniref:Uncharacterized protein n=1 Tax=Streptomyces spongiicola TaxID=1690221 RepID=A0A388T2X4_9ACTN|nr:hypothetical protein SSP531S_43600 [Streptomyces spongiicola]